MILAFPKKKLEEMGVTKQDAQLYATGSLMLKQVCVDAWDAVTQENYDCTRNTFVSNWDYINQCAITAAEKIKKDPANKCKYLQEYVECFDQPFEESCDPIVAKTACNLNKIQFDPFYNCSIQCSASSLSLKASKHFPDANKPPIYLKSKDVLLDDILKVPVWPKYF